MAHHTQRGNSLRPEDAAVAHAEYEAFPERAQHNSGAQALEREYQEMHSPRSEIRPEPPIEEAEELPLRHRDGRRASAATTSSSMSTTEPESIRAAARQRSKLGSHMSATSTRMEEAFMQYLDRHPTAMKRIDEHRLQHAQTVGSRRTGLAADESKWPAFGGNKPYPPPLPERDEYVVEFDGHEDPLHAQNWPMKRKLTVSAILILDALAATFASSVLSPADTAIGDHFHIGQEVVTLGTSLFVLGYACGPIMFAPMSELYGRRLPIIIAAFAFGIFNIGVAVSKDVQTFMICRFFAGLMGSCPLTVVAAVFSDMFSNETRGVSVACFSATVICGPFTGPFIGGFITKSYLGWRWTAYIPAFMGFAASALAVVFQQESYGPVVLVGKASELRRLTRNWGIHAKQEEVEVDLKELLSKNLTRPLRILFTEPIVLLVTIYMSFIYGILYLCLTAYALIFGDVYGFSLGVQGLPYIAMIVGVGIAFATVVLMNKSYVKKLQANNNIPVPEWRLPLTMVGGILFSAGLFWLGWGGYMKSTPWIVPTLAGLFIGFGIYSVFLQCLNYIIDAYLMFAASAVAANTIMRSLFGAIFPLFATYMYEGIGIEWANTLLGCVAALFIPMPFLFYFYGKRIRARSTFAPALDIQQENRRDEESRGDAEKGEMQAEAAHGRSDEGAMPPDSHQGKAENKDE